MMATKTPNSVSAQKAIRTNLSSLYTSLRVAQILSVTAGYSQKKKDSVQAVFIQRYADCISLRGSVTNYPDYIGLASRRPNIIGSVQRLPDDIGLVQHNNHVNDVHEVQPLDSMPLLSSSRRRSRLIHPDLLSSPSSFMAIARRSDNSLSRRNCTTWRSLVSFVDIVNSCGLTCNRVDNVLHCMTLCKAKPRSVGALTGLLTTNDNLSIEVAMNKHITPVTGRNSLTPNIVFTWRFAECQENKAIYHHVTAHTEDEARSQLPGLLLVFTARIRQGVNYV